MGNCPVNMRVKYYSAACNEEPTISHIIDHLLSPANFEAHTPFPPYAMLAITLLQTLRAGDANNQAIV